MRYYIGRLLEHLYLTRAPVWTGKLTAGALDALRAKWDADGTQYLAVAEPSGFLVYATEAFTAEVPAAIAAALGVREGPARRLSAKLLPGEMLLAVHADPRRRYIFSDSWGRLISTNGEG